jgi:peptide/nickel transport system substrate-binding protein
MPLPLQNMACKGGSVMSKLIVGSIALMLVTFGWGASSFGQEVPMPRGELRVVDKHPGNWITITVNVFEHLMELDHDGQLIPRLATAWRWVDDRTLDVTLRQGATFHNGEVFDAEIVKLNWEENIRVRQPHRSGT